MICKKQIDTSTAPPAIEGENDEMRELRRLRALVGMTGEEPAFKNDTPQMQITKLRRLEDIANERRTSYTTPIPIRTKNRGRGLQPS